jgi:hypothetical protein
MIKNNNEKSIFDNPVALFLGGFLLAGLHRKKKARKEKELADAERVKKLEERIKELENK